LGRFFIVILNLEKKQKTVRTKINGLYGDYARSEPKQNQLI